MQSENHTFCLPQRAMPCHDFFHAIRKFLPRPVVPGRTVGGRPRQSKRARLTGPVQVRPGRSARPVRRRSARAARKPSFGVPPSGGGGRRGSPTATRPGTVAMQARPLLGAQAFVRGSAQPVGVRNAGARRMRMSIPFHSKNPSLWDACEVKPRSRLGVSVFPVESADFSSRGLRRSSGWRPGPASNRPSRRRRPPSPRRPRHRPTGHAAAGWPA